MTLSQYIGKKVGMTQIFDDEGNALPVTVVELLPLTVVQVKTEANDGYAAVQMGYQEGKEKHLTRAQQGHFKKNNLPLQRRLKEFRLDAKQADAFTVGDILDPFAETSPLASGQKIQVTGRSIGKGFQGGTKRWGFSRGPMSHGSKSHRIPGSIGAGTTPGRVLKGKKMAGRMGNKQITTRGLKVVRVIPEKRVVLVYGTVPGVEGGTLVLRQA